MKKEFVICIIIFIIILFGNIITQKYTKESVKHLTEDLSELKIDIFNKINNEENEQKQIIEKIEKIVKNWESKHDKLAYYIEHNELEKVEDNLTGLKSLTETEEYKEAVKELDKGIFILKHIEEKYKFSLENIF